MKSPDRRVAILDTVFIQGHRQIVFGGAERYLIQLLRLLRDLDYEPKVWQPGTIAHAYDGIEVVGIPPGEIDYGTLPELNLLFHERTMEYTKFVYFTPMLAYPRVKPGSVVVSHSLFWDYPGYQWAASEGPLRDEWLRRLHYAATAPDLFVSVDTNMLNWLRATWPGYEGRQVYIPNFVDLDSFSPREKQGDQLVVLFPRRLDWNRGLEEAKAAALALASRHARVEFHFVGQGASSPVEADMWQWAEDHPRCRYYWVPMERMPEVYRSSDIVIIPTKCCEGTSLSCLEAMACGKAVVCGRVGGLTDLVIDGFNGRLIHVSPEGLFGAVEELILDPAKRHRLGVMARKTAESFSLERWRRRWTEALGGAWG